MTGFPQVVLGLKYELLVNGTWTDISEFVYQRDDQVIQRGRPTETSQIQPAQLTLTLNNRDGRFSPKNTGGAYYPYIGRNTQLRCSVNTTSSSGTTYSGFRFWGEVSSWPPQWDPSGSDVYVQITCGGILRRYIQGNNLGSALRRFYLLKTDATAPVSYWPCEEGSTAQQLGNLITPGDDITWTGTPSLASNSDFEGSDPLPLVSNSAWTGITGLFSTSGPAVFSTPGTFPWTCPGGITSLTSGTTTGAGGGAANGVGNAGSGGFAGGGGECAQETSVAVTPLKQYLVTVGAGGQGGSLSTNGTGNNGTAGGLSTVTFDSVTITGHGGTGGNHTTGVGTGGTGSTNAAHHNGGNGGHQTGTSNGGGSGGGSAGPAAAGNNGNSTSSNTGASAPAAVSGGGAGGAGGNGGNGVDAGGLPGAAPGGGGGAGGRNSANNAGHSGGNGGAGTVTLNWASSTTPNNVVLRFLLSIPAASTPADGATLFRAVVSSGTLSKIECYYSVANAGSLSIRGYNTSSTKVFDSAGTVIQSVNGVPLMVSLELAKSGTGINWEIEAIQPGLPTTFGVIQAGATGTLASSTMGAVSQILVAPNSDITDTAIGHIVLQYALEPLAAVSDAINGHDGELATDRFARICAEESFTGTALFNEGKDHWGFESGTGSWTGASNCTVAQTTYSQPSLGFSGAGWPTEGTHSLQITPGNTSAFYARSPSGTSGLPCVPGDVVCASADASAENGPTSLVGAYLAVEWFTSGGTSISVTTGVAGANLSTAINDKLRVIGTAPATAAFFAIRAGAAASLGSANVMVIDNVSIGAAMGPQRDESLTSLLQEIEDAGQGQLVEARDMLGMYYTTRLAMMGQSADVALNYTAAMLAGSLQPAYDDARTRNDISLSRLNGSTISQQLSSGALSVSLPPSGVGDYNYSGTVNVTQDAQLANLVAWMLAIGTVDQYRYPNITIDLARAEVAGSGVFDATAGLDVGAYLQIINPPAWVPESPVKQLCWGFTETLNAFQWTIDVNAVPETPYEATSYGWW